MEPLITNERANREWLYIVNKVGEKVALEAINKLPGKQRPYPINIAKVLKIMLPIEEKLPHTDEKRVSRESAAEENLAQLRALVKYW